MVTINLTQANGTGKKEESGLPKGLDRYELGEELGRGHFATVRLCRDKVSGNQYAVKIIDKRDFAKDEETVMAEIKILQQVGRHQHIVSLLDTFEDPKDFYLVMEYCSGGDLFSKIVDEGKVTHTVVFMS